MTAAADEDGAVHVVVDEVSVSLLGSVRLVLLLSLYICFCLPGSQVF